MGEAATARPGRAHLVLGSQPNVAQAEAHARSRGVGARETQLHATCDHAQRHSAASASTVEESGAQGTVRLLRAWVKPLPLGRGARTSFWALNPTWRKRWRTLVLAVLARAKPQLHATCDHQQRHSGASASTVEQSGAQGTVRLLRAWVKPLPLGRGARTSFWALNPAWRKRWRTLVLAVLARAKPSYTRTATTQRHSAASASTVEESGAQGTVRLLRAWVKPLPLGRGARTSFWALNPAWRKRWRTLVLAVLARAKPQLHAACDHQQRHSAASASTVEQSGAQGTVRLLRAWVKPLPLGRGARTSFWALNPTWRKRWRTLVLAVLARAKPSYTRTGHQQRHSAASASTVEESGAQGTVRLLRAWVKPLPLGRGARTSFWALNPTWRKR